MSEALLVDPKPLSPEPQILQSCDSPDRNLPGLGFRKVEKPKL